MRGSLLGCNLERLVFLARLVQAGLRALKLLLRLRKASIQLLEPLRRRSPSAGNNLLLLPVKLN